MTDCAAIRWLMTYKGNNHAVICLQLELLAYWFTIAVRPGTMLEDANYYSRLGKDVHIDPLLKDYLSFGRQLYVDHPADKGEVHQIIYLVVGRARRLNKRISLQRR
jgi:hypothetical protein